MRSSSPKGGSANEMRSSSPKGDSANEMRSSSPKGGGANEMRSSSPKGGSAASMRQDLIWRMEAGLDFFLPKSIQGGAHLGPPFFMPWRRP
jgi:hypothetical protein